MKPSSVKTLTLFIILTLTAAFGVSGCHDAKQEQPAETLNIGELSTQIVLEPESAPAVEVPTPTPEPGPSPECTTDKNCSDGRVCIDGKCFAIETPTPEPGPPPDAACINVTEPVGTETVNISEKTGLKGRIHAFGGNASEPVAAYDAAHNYIVWLSNDTPPKVVITKYDGKNASATVPVNITSWEDKYKPDAHDAPSVFVDGQGYIYVTYFGNILYYKDFYNNEPFSPTPIIRRSTFPHDISSWQPEERGRLGQGAGGGEINGFRLNDGAVLMAGSDLASRIDIIEPGGTYRWSAARQVITKDSSEKGDPETGIPGNRFTKAVYEPGHGTPQRIYVVWGWTSDGKYWEDSHEVFFAYSNDGGLNWKNKDGTKEVSAPLAPVSEEYYNGDITKGILHYDPDFKITTTRQGEHRALWEAEDGTIYLAFSKSITHENPPGALMMLKFKLGGIVEEKMINKDEHKWIGGIRKVADTIYVWTYAYNGQENIYEYSSKNEGKTWERKELSSPPSVRVFGMTSIPGLNSIRMAWEYENPESYNKSLSIYYYRRTFPCIKDQ